MASSSEESYTRQYIILSVLTICMLLVGIIQGKISFADYWLLKEKRDLYAQKVKNLEEETQELELEIERVSYSKQYARKILREKYHLLEENEKIFFFSE